MDSCFTSYAFQPGPISYGIENPVGSAALHISSELFGTISILCFMAVLTGVLATVALRFRRSRGVECLQIQWFLYATAWAYTGFIAASLFFNNPVLNGIAWAMGFISLGLIPLAVGVAILRYRLFDIDLIIRRTLLYALLSAILGLVYFGGVVVLKQVFRSLTGRSGQSPVTIVLSTLAIAALFSPLRRRLQEGIDRRFYRKHYTPSAPCRF